MTNSVAIVTGASQGIGRATAVRLAKDFAAVALVARNRSNLEETARAVEAAGAQSLIIDLDLSAPISPVCWRSGDGTTPSSCLPGPKHSGAICRAR